MQTVTKALNLIGDDAAVCAALKSQGYIIKAHVPRDWRRRNSIPAGFWAGLSKACPNITPKVLADLHAKPVEGEVSA